MSAGNSALSSVAAVVGNGADHRRAAGGESAAAVTAAPTAVAIVSGIEPSVTISASAIAVAIGDKLLGTIIGPDTNGNRHFVAAQGIFAVDPQAALEGLSSATIEITRTSRGIEALLLPQASEGTAVPVPIKLQLVQANVAQLTQTLEPQHFVALDSPVTLAVQIADALREIGQLLPQGFAQTPQVAALIKATPLEAAISVAAVAAQAPTEDGAPVAAMSVIGAPGKTSPLQPALQAQIIQPLAADSDLQPPQNISLLFDLPDTPANRTMMVQSPLFSGLLKHNRLIVVATPLLPQAPAQQISPAAMAHNQMANDDNIPVILQDVRGYIMPLPPSRLLVFIDTTASGTPAHVQSLPTVEDAEIIQQLPSWLSDPMRPADMASRSLAPLLSLKPQLPADIMLLFNIIGRKAVPVVASKLAQLRYGAREAATAAATEPPLMDALRNLARAAPQISGQAEPAQRLLLPLQVDGQILPLVFIFTEPSTGQNQQADGAPTEDLGEDAQHFSLAIDFPTVGPLTLHGRCHPRYLNLAVKTRQALPAALQASTTALFLATLEVAGMTGRLHFVAG
jgi:hypothetical protein